MPTEKQLANLKMGNPATRFTSGRSAVENGRKGGLATAAKKRRKGATKKYLKELLALTPTLTSTDIRVLEKVGVPSEVEGEYDNEFLIAMVMVAKARAGDLKAQDMIQSYIGEDPHTLAEERRMKLAQSAVEAMKNSDGFMDAMGATVGEVFEDGSDTPDALEDSE